MSYTGGNIQQTYAMLQRIYEIMNKIEAQGKKTETQINRSNNELRAYLSLLSGIASLSQRLAGTEDQKQLISTFQSVITLLIQIRLQYQLTMTALGPVGIALVAVGAVGTAMTAGSLAMDVMGDVY